MSKTNLVIIILFSIILILLVTIIFKFSENKVGLDKLDLQYKKNLDLIESERRKQDSILNNIELVQERLDNLHSDYVSYKRIIGSRQKIIDSLEYEITNNKVDYTDSSDQSLLEKLGRIGQ